MTPKEKEDILSALRENEKICEVISEWTEEQCKRLENPKTWDKKEFEIDGKSNLKAASKLRMLIARLIRKEVSDKGRTSYE